MTGLQTAPGSFRNPHSLGHRLARASWNLVWLLLYRPTLPRLMAGWRRFLLRCYGAKIGHVYIHPSARVWAPWRLAVGDEVFIDRDVNLYNAFGITIESRITISQGAFLCTATHDYTRPEFPLIGKPIIVAADTWIAAQAFIAPGVTVGRGAVVGARAMVVRNVDPWTVVAGNPAGFIKARKLLATQNPADEPAAPA